MIEDHILLDFQVTSKTTNSRRNFRFMARSCMTNENPMHSEISSKYQKCLCKSCVVYSSLWSFFLKFLHFFKNHVVWIRDTMWKPKNNIVKIPCPQFWHRNVNVKANATRWVETLELHLKQSSQLWWKNYSLCAFMWKNLGGTVTDCL